MNYQEQTELNKQNFLNEEAYRERRELLFYIARKFDNLGIRWCLNCSSTLFFRGIAKKFHDFDILVDFRDISRALEVVKKMHAMDLTKGDQSKFASTFFNKYQVGNVKFDLFSEWRIKDGGVGVEYCYNEEDVENIMIGEMEIPIISAEIQWMIYATLGLFEDRRKKQAVSIAQYILDQHRNDEAV